jgi:SAM-dependent methyltransferase
VTEAEPGGGFDEELPYPFEAFNFIASVATLDTANDLPGALIHIRNALAPGGRAVASFLGAGSLPVLRRVMLAADGERPAARFHPMVDVRAGAQLLQRAGWAEPVADSRTLGVAYRSLDRLVDDLRAQGLGNVLSRHAPLTKAALERAREAFAAEADERGRVVESFEILTLSGRRA